MPSWLMTFRFVRRARLDAWYWNKTACYSSEGTASQLPVADLEPPSPFMDDSLLVAAEDSGVSHFKWRIRESINQDGRERHEIQSLILSRASHFIMPHRQNG